MDWLHFIGREYYPNISDFVKEAAEYGVSRRIDERILKKFNFGDRVFLFQKVKGRNYSKMFGYFVVEVVLGSSLDVVIETLEKEEPKIKASDQEREILRRCGLYKIIVTHHVSASVPEINEKIMKSEAENILVGGTFYLEKELYSDISFQKGFRPFNYEQFDLDRRKNKNNGSTVRNRVKGYFYDEVKETTSPNKVGKIGQIKNYVKRPHTQDQIKIFEAHKKELVTGQVEWKKILDDGVRSRKS